MKTTKTTSQFFLLTLPIIFLGLSLTSCGDEYGDIPGEYRLVSLDLFDCENSNIESSYSESDKGVCITGQTIAGCTTTNLVLSSDNTFSRAYKYELHYIFTGESELANDNIINGTYSIDSDILSLSVNNTVVLEYNIMPDGTLESINTSGFKCSTRTTFSKMN